MTAASVSRERGPIVNIAAARLPSAVRRTPDSGPTVMARRFWLIAREEAFYGIMRRYIASRFTSKGTDLGL